MVVPVLKKRAYWQKRDAEDAAYEQARAARPYVQYLEETHAPVVEPQPESFEMPAPMHSPMTMTPTLSPEEHRMAPHYSAPPSRPADMSEYGANPYQDDPRRVRLSIEEQQVARAAGLSDIEYARQKLRLEQARRDDPDRYRSRG
jgi:hypothetical protein